jgi:hypothetical protein
MAVTEKEKKIVVGVATYFAFLAVLVTIFFRKVIF